MNSTHPQQQYQPTGDSQASIVHHSSSSEVVDVWGQPAAVEELESEVEKGGGGGREVEIRRVKNESAA